MVKAKSSKLKWIVRIIGIFFFLFVGFFIGAGYSTKFLMEHYKQIHAGNVFEQISYLTMLHEGLTEDVIENKDQRLVYGLYSFDTSDPRGLPEDVSKWPDFTLQTWQKAKEYYEQYPSLLEGQSEEIRFVRRILEKVPDSERRIKEKEFAKQHVGKAAPAFDVSEWIGEPVGLEQLQGKVVLLDFWGNWCVPCKKKLPMIQELHDKYKGDGLEVIGIHSLKDSEKAAEFLSNNNYTFRTALDTGKSAQNYSVLGWPTYYLIDKQGKLAWGPEHSVPPEELIESLLQE